MRIAVLFSILLWVGSLCVSPVHLSWALELKGNLSGQFRYFPSSQLFDDQERNAASSSFEIEGYHDLSDDLSLTFTPFFRYDSADDERTHGDIRKLYLLWVREQFELGVGVYKVYWGVTEVVHIVDIINQTDVIDALDGEEKLGQPMISLSLPSKFGVLDVFLLPFFRERTFPGDKGRLRFGIPILDDESIYESTAEEYHFDWAVRYTKSLRSWELGFSYFEGTGREPWFLVIMSSEGIGLAPYYPKIKQSGIELQYILSNWLWKLEIIYREGQPNLKFERENYLGLTGGFEYTFFSIFGSYADLGMIVEGLYDSRQTLAITPYEEEIAFGFRLTLNDMRSTELLFLTIKDIEDSSRTISLESSMRLGEAFKVSIEAMVFSEQDSISLFESMDNDAILSDFRDDSYIQFEVTYHF
ncbi:MAG: hypothetical protein SWO11_07825 [Thermodesulfobacteriota bacterium]|nr:hypothetical protein [Thermodesulfobacteriota bacterium]